MRHGRINRQAIRALTELPAVRQKGRDIAEDIADDARNRAPRSGDQRGIPLADTITVTEHRDAAGTHHTVDVGAPHAAAVEYGTEDTPAQPFIRPAADRYR